MTGGDGHAFAIIYGQRLMAQSEKAPVSFLGLQSWQEIHCRRLCDSCVWLNKQKNTHISVKVVFTFIFSVLEKKISSHF